ncbi:MAG TPA: hypothetical protein VKC99_10160 [Methyloceanibacter sp.]|nr:hypothetical protein [Methyloceanibacter sp.]
MSIGKVARWGQICPQDALSVPQSPFDYEIVLHGSRTALRFTLSSAVYFGYRVAYPGRMAWDYDRIEIIADGIIHATGISLGLVGAIAIIIVAVDLPRIEITSMVIYILGLVAMLGRLLCRRRWAYELAAGRRGNVGRGENEEGEANFAFVEPEPEYGPVPFCRHSACTIR